MCSDIVLSERMYVVCLMVGRYYIGSFVLFCVELCLHVENPRRGLISSTKRTTLCAPCCFRCSLCCDSLVSFRHSTNP